MFKLFRRVIHIYIYIYIYIYIKCLKQYDGSDAHSCNDGSLAVYSLLRSSLDFFCSSVYLEFIAVIVFHFIMFHFLSMHSFSVLFFSSSARLWRPPEFILGLVNHSVSLA